MLHLPVNPEYHINIGNMKRRILVIVLFALSVIYPVIGQEGGDFLIVTEHGVSADGKSDASEAIQKLIEANPHRTLIFPDGTYLLSKPIETPADPARSVSLELSHYAVLKAAEGWREGALVRLGATYKANDIGSIGSNYGLKGGMIDGSGVADGVSIDGGRETKIEDVSIKHTRIGIHIKFGANSGSSDSDIVNVNIVGNNTAESIGVLIEGYDNSLTNMRIAAVHTGVVCKSGGNSLRNIHPLYYMSCPEYETSCGFELHNTINVLNYCYSDQMATGFRFVKGAKANLTDCLAFWYSGAAPFETAISCDGRFDAMVSGFMAVFRDDCKTQDVLKVGEGGGKGLLLHPQISTTGLSDEDVSAEYIR